MRARAGGREYHGRAPSTAPVLSPAEATELDSSPAEADEAALPSAEVAVTDRAPAEADESAVFSVGPVATASAEHPPSDREDAADSAGCADSPAVPAASSEVPAASSVAPVLSDCSSSFTQRARRFSRMRI